MMTVPGDTRVPIIHDRNEERRVLVVGPVGSPVRPVSGGRPVCGRQLADLVQPLETAHRLGIVHRDVKLQNIFLHGNDGEERIFLNDWGSSCALNSRQMFVGTYGYCDSRVPGQALVLCSAEADLRGLVRTAFAMYTGLAPPHDCELAERFWAERFRQDSIWQRGMECAKLLRYDDLRALFMQL